jgi:putative SOS response-associated peptidase YedK
MCGRYALHTPAGSLATVFALPNVPALTPRYNIAPGQLTAVIGVRPDDRRGLELFRWGFVSRWANDPNAGPHPASAAAESITGQVPYRDSFHDRRCLLPADGWYEWGPPGAEAPHYVRSRTGGPLAFAGVWDAWRPRRLAALDPPLLTCAVITVPAVEPVKAVHDRMPLVLPPDRWDRWLDPNAPARDVLSLLVPPPAEMFEVVRVGPLVNDVGNDGPECLAAEQ